MAHMLKTINPEAAAAFGAASAIEASAVAIGDVVVFHPRPGMRREGRNEFPAIVLNVHEGDRLDVIVVMDAGDMWRQDRLPRASDENPFHAWTLRDSAREVEPFEPSRLNGMTRDLAELKQAIFADFATPPKSIMEYLDDFGRRLTKLEKAAKK